MAKAYKITIADEFKSDTFDYAPYLLDRQRPIEGVPQLPESNIYKSRETVVHEDFTRYLIEHEMEENAWGRYNTSVFHSYIRKEAIHGYYSPNKQILLLSGKKRFVLDFCKKTESIEEIALRLMQIDMGQLLSKLPHVKGVWFRFKNGLIRASALMGANIESTADFQKYSSEGDISTLSFYYDHNNAAHPLMVVNDGTIVLYSNYPHIADELNLVMRIKNELLDDITQTVTI